MHRRDHREAMRHLVRTGAIDLAPDGTIRNYKPERRSHDLSKE
jgi:hypothetical protein